MKVTILNEYDDKELKRRVKVNEVLDLDKDRIETLKSVGVNVEEYKEELSDDLDKGLQPAKNAPKMPKVKPAKTEE